MLCNLLHAMLMRIPVCYIPNYYMQNCVSFYLAPFLLHRIGNLLANVATISVAIFANCQGLVAQMRGQGTINLLVVGLIPPQQKSFFKVYFFYFTLWS